jgi:hypothetical protein
MRKTDRRTFLKLMGSPALMAALPVNISRTLDIPANNVETGEDSISDPALGAV